jgi:hypothetical protein
MLWCTALPFLTLIQTQFLILFTDTDTLTELEVLMEQNEAFVGNTYSWLKTFRASNRPKKQQFQSPRAVGRETQNFLKITC